jgi:succinoglycan biosynthesis protein ExoM
VRLAVCIVTCRRPDGLARLLAALAGQSVPAGVAAEVVVVDNDPRASGRGPALQAAARLPWPLVYRVEPRPGVSFARNAALDAAAGCDLVAFVDDDEEPAPGWLAELVACQGESDAAAVTGPAVPRFERAPPPWLAAAVALCYIRPRPGQPLAELMSGNLLVVPAALERHGIRFDERLALIGGEDTVLAKELVRAGERIVWAERAVVHEHLPAARARLSWILRRWYRTGNIEALVAMRARDGLRGRVVGICGGLARVGGGVLALAATLPWLVRGEPERALRRLYTVARGLGMVAAVLGRHHHEYRAVHAAR